MKSDCPERRAVERLFECIGILSQAITIKRKHYSYHSNSIAVKLMYNQSMEFRHMITALRQKVKIERGGVINLRSRKLKAGTTAEVIVLVEDTKSRKNMTAADLLKSGLVGMWADRKDIGDSLEFARTLRSQASQRDNQK
jgi:hypothetical protein